MSEKLINRFASLIEEGATINAYQSNSNGDNSTFFSNCVEWQVKSQSILEIACGKESHHLTRFTESMKFKMGDTNKTILNRLIPILRAAKDDLENGFLISFKQIIQAEVFDSELEQASHFLENGYVTAAAVTAGVVLETAIKELCKNKGIEINQTNSNKPKRLDMLNGELTKAGVYNVLQQKRITAIADIRNNAAHGNINQFNEHDVKDMIRDIERFLIEYSS